MGFGLGFRAQGCWFRIHIYTYIHIYLVVYSSKLSYLIVCILWFEV